jgi:hypothetical protein
MSIKLEFRQPKKNKKEKRPQNSCQFKWRAFEGAQAEFQSVFMFLSIGIPYYKEGRVDEVKIIKLSDFKSLSNHSQIETPSRTIFDLTQESPIHL